MIRIIQTLIILMLTCKTFANPTKDTIKIGIATGYAPYISLNEKGDYEGFDIDFAVALGTKIDRKIEFRDLGSMTTLMLSLQKGDIDCIIWGLSITEERRRKFTMLHYYGEVTDKQPLVFWRKTDSNINSLQDMQNKNIAVEPGSIQDKLVTEYPSINVKYFDKTIDMLMEIKFGRCDAALVDPDILSRYKNKFPNLEIVDLKLDAADIRRGIGIAMMKNNKKLEHELSRGIAELKNEGFMAKIENKWLKNAGDYN